MDSFLIRLKEERGVKGLSQKQMAGLLNIPLRAYQNYEALGVNQTEPDLHMLVKIADVLDVSLDDLLGREG